MRHRITLFAYAAYVNKFRVAYVHLLNRGETWRVSTSTGRAESREAADVLALARAVRALKLPCEIHLVTASHALMLSAEADKSRRARDEDSAEAWEEFDRAVADGGHAVTSGQGNPDHLVIQAAAAVARALVDEGRPADELARELERVTPALLKAEEASSSGDLFVLRLAVTGRRHNWLTPTGDLLPFHSDPRAARACDLAEPDQLAVIRRLARTHRLDADEECRAQLRCETGDLSAYAAGWFITYLHKTGEEANAAAALVATAAA